MNNEYPMYVNQMNARQRLRVLTHFFLLIAMVFMTSCESRRTIVNGLDEREANEILVFLSNRNIDAVKVQAATEGGGGGGGIALWNISVTQDQATEAMALLNQAGLPRKRGQNLLGIFSNVGLVPSGMHEKVRYQAGLAEQIASTIRKIDGVLDSDVQISFPEEDPLNPTAPKGKITASVYVKHTGVLDDPNAHLMTRIKRLVAGSINGLDYDNVTVIGDRARYSETPATGYQAGSEEERHLVNIWSITLAKDSLTMFRIIFFSFSILLLLLLLTLVWLIWKIYPILKQNGGFKQLLTLHPLHTGPAPEPAAEAAAAPAEAKPEEPKAAKTEEEDTAGKGIDET